MPTKQKTSPSVGTEKPQCHIHDKVETDEVDDIRQIVCVNDLPLAEHTDGNRYCLFHLPTKEKDIEKFREIFNARLDTIDKKISETEDLPGEDRVAALRKLRYDFRYVWFSFEIDLNNRTFSATADFSSATFFADADFSSATFSAYAYFSSATFFASTSFRSATFSASSYFRSATFSASVYFSSATFSAYADFSSAAFSGDADFNSATFSADADFNSATFSADANFRSATFSATAYFNWATFSATAYFKSATFSADADFGSATFSAYAYFSSATFSAYTYFSSATFSAYASFSSATFSASTYFRSAKFEEASQVFFRNARFHALADFNYSVFTGYVSFEGAEGEKVFKGMDGENTIAFLNLQNARLVKPERISFHRVRLRPGWFVNVDSRKIVFTDVDWDYLDAKRGNSNIADEIVALEQREVSEPSRLLEIACRQLAVNAEENNRYEEAAKFRYMAMETKLLEYKDRFPFLTLNWWYRLSSGYGENWKRALVVLIALLTFFGVLFWSPLSKFDYGDPKIPVTAQDAVEKEIETVANDAERFHSMNIGEGIVHSLYIAALQRPEPKAADTLTKFFVIMETILGPLQAALLALAIRRKFMR